MRPNPNLAQDEFKNAQQLGEYLSHQNAPIYEFAHIMARAMLDGKNPSKAKGQGDDFWQFRQFENYEDVNSIDWRQSGKSDKLFIREFERLHPMQIGIWCDLSNQMFYKNPKHPQKAKISIIMAIALFIALKKHKIDFKIGDKKISKTPNLIASLLENKNQIVQKFAPTPYLIICDGLREIGFWNDFIKSAKSQGAKLFFIIINDINEIEFDFNGAYDFHSFENDEKIKINNCQAIKSEYQSAVLEHFAQLELILKNEGFENIKIRNDFDLQHSGQKIWEKLISFLNRL